MQTTTEILKARAPQWLPIETAPKGENGFGGIVFVDLWAGNSRYPNCFYDWEARHWVMRIRYLTRKGARKTHHLRIQNPTHWQPLPTPPGEGMVMTTTPSEPWEPATLKDSPDAEIEVETASEVATPEARLQEKLERAKDALRQLPKQCQPIVVSEKGDKAHGVVGWLGPSLKEAVKSILAELEGEQRV